MDLACVAELFLNGRGGGRLQKLSEPGSGVCEAPRRQFDAKRIERCPHRFAILRFHLIIGTNWLLEQSGTWPGPTNYLASSPRPTPKVIATFRTIRCS